MSNEEHEAGDETYLGSLEDVDRQADLLRRLLGRPLTSVRAQWYTHDPSPSGWFVEGAMALVFGDLAVELSSPGAGCDIHVVETDKLSNDDFEYEEAVITWRQDPWHELHRLCGLTLQKLTLLGEQLGGELLGLRVVLDDETVWVLADNDDLHWSVGKIPIYAKRFQERAL